MHSAAAQGQTVLMSSLHGMGMMGDVGMRSGSSSSSSSSSSSIAIAHVV
jgi:hypothetical protein